jgi:hypothetical protein
MQVTLRVRDMLLSACPRQQVWVACWLQLVRSSSRAAHAGEQELERLWRWMNDSGFPGWLAQALLAPNT